METKKLLRQLCRVYHGEADNPFAKNVGDTFDKWNYLKLHIWDVERAVSTGYDQWRAMFKEHYPDADYSGDALVEEVYKYAIKTMLRKMERDDIDFTAMYFEL